MNNHPRIDRLIAEAIRNFKLDLSGLTVLTEGATNYFAFTPLIAARAGAKRVFVLGGTEQSVWYDTSIRQLTSRSAPEIGECDIVLNLKGVRPIDAPLITRLKDGAVISLMYEAWEQRAEDIDVVECKRRGIPILPTDEDDSRLLTMNYVGLLAVKLLFELDIEVCKSYVIVLGNGKFGDAVEVALIRAGAITTRNLNNYAINHADAIVVAEHTHKDPLIGLFGDIDGGELKWHNPGLVIAHIAGNVDQEDIDRAGIRHKPEVFAKPGYMSVTTAYLGPKPVIDLHTAGMKVAEKCLRSKDQL